METSSANASTNFVEFPTGFVWGAATSSYQIEGDRGGRGDNIWDLFCREPGAILDGSSGDVACDHIGRWTEDLQLLDDLDVGAYRFSIAWPRVDPDGRGGGGGLAFYDHLVDELLNRGIEPFPTLYHWDLPVWLHERGGWTGRSTAEAFAQYAADVVSKLGDRVTQWTTLNEPFVVAEHGYISAEHAPGYDSIDKGLAAAHHLLLAHGMAAEAIRSTSAAAKVGIVLNFTPAVAFTDDPADVLATERVDDFENRWYIEPIAGLGYPAAEVERLGWSRHEVLDGDMEIISAPLDHLGVNFYTRQVVAADKSLVPDPTAATAMGWEIHPDSLEDLLCRLHQHYGFERLYITENGAAMPDTTRRDGRVDDQDRIEYLHHHLAAVSRAIDRGVPVDGYFVWSLLDNFEWAHGYDKKFGIVEVDFDTLERIPKASAEWYGAVAASNRLPALPAADESESPESERLEVARRRP